MSLIGPRPTLRYQVERYTERQRRRLEVLPGITGWAQIHGRATLSWDERIELDVWYVEHRSAAHRSPHPAAHAARPLRRHLQGRDRRLEGLASLARDGGSLHVRGPARRHRRPRSRVRARRRSRPTSTRSRRRSTTRTGTRLVPRIADPGYIPALAAARRGARGAADRAADGSRPASRSSARATSSTRSCCCRTRRSCGASATSTSRTSSSRSAGSPHRRAGCRTRSRTTRATRCSSRCARASARGTSIRAHDRAELEFFLRYTSVDSFVQTCCARRGVLDRRLLRPRRRAA